MYINKTNFTKSMFLIKLYFVTQKHVKKRMFKNNLISLYFNAFNIDQFKSV